MSKIINGKDTTDLNNIRKMDLVARPDTDGGIIIDVSIEPYAGVKKYKRVQLSLSPSAAQELESQLRESRFLSKRFKDQIDRRERELMGTFDTLNYGIGPRGHSF